MTLNNKLASDEEDLPYLIPITDGDVLARNYSELVDTDVARDAVLEQLDRDEIDVAGLGVIGVKRLTKVARNLIDAGQAFSEMQTIKLYALNLLGAKMLEHGMYEFDKTDLRIKKMHSHFYSHAANCATDLAAKCGLPNGNHESNSADIMRLNGTKYHGFKNDAKDLLNVIGAEANGLERPEVDALAFWLKRAAHWYSLTGALSGKLDPVHSAVAHSFAGRSYNLVYAITGEVYYLGRRQHQTMLAAQRCININKTLASDLFNDAAQGIEDLLDGALDANLENLVPFEYRSLKRLLEKKAKYFHKSGELIADEDCLSSAYRFMFSGNALMDLYVLKVANGYAFRRVLKNVCKTRTRSAELFILAENYELAGMQYAQKGSALTRLFEGDCPAEDKLDALLSHCEARRLSAEAYERAGNYEVAARQKLLFGSSAVLANDMLADDSIRSEAIDLVTEAYVWFTESAKSLPAALSETAFEYFDRAIECAMVVHTLDDTVDNKTWRSRTLFACDELLRAYKHITHVAPLDNNVRAQAIEIKARFAKMTGGARARKKNQSPDKTTAIDVGVETQYAFVASDDSVASGHSDLERALSDEKEVLVFECPECGAEIDEDAVECSCGVAFEADVFDEYEEI